jgi:hypothetical protein
MVVGVSAETVQGEPPKSTLTPEIKSDPLIVSNVPPLRGPFETLKEVTVGAGR